jgi:hypothetical protein
VAAARFGSSVAADCTVRRYVITLPDAMSVITTSRAVVVPPYYWPRVLAGLAAAGDLEGR